MSFEVLSTCSIETPSVSVVVPVYNMEENGFLACCLDSLVAQDLKDLEIICVDDASTDNSLKLLCDYASKYSNLTVLGMQKNSRQGTACNYGIRFARGIYIGFVDADDYVSPDFYSSLWAKAQETDADIVEAPVQVVDEVGAWIGEAKTAFPEECLTEAPRKYEVLDPTEKISRVIMRHPSPRFCIQKAEIVKKPGNEFLEGMRYEDTPTFLKWIYGFETFARTLDGRYYYRQHAASTVHSTAMDVALLRDRLKSADMILDDAIDLGKIGLYRDSLYRYYLRVYLFNTFSMLVPFYKVFDADVIKDIVTHAKERVPGYKKMIAEDASSKRNYIGKLIMIEWPMMYCRLQAIRNKVKKTK